MGIHAHSIPSIGSIKKPFQFKIEFANKKLTFKIKIIKITQSYLKKLGRGETMFYPSFNPIAAAIVLGIFLVSLLSYVKFDFVRRNSWITKITGGLPTGAMLAIAIQTLSQLLRFGTLSGLFETLFLVIACGVFALQLLSPKKGSGTIDWIFITFGALLYLFIMQNYQ
jgi:hypothetical protein